ncbi:MAG TPA: TIR domain-containing protein [Pyrinomonadaceae bacterium]|nr:TIR domain-containing protein [Pyrinomonadaceae bacterium]
MRQQFQVLPGLNGPPTAVVTSPLPFLATANDVRGVVHYLRKKPDGVTLGEAVDAIKKQAFEPGKLATYELLGITVRNGDRFKLSQFGWEMARRLEPEAQAFRALLNNVGPYRATLQWACRRKLGVITHPEVAAQWHEHYPEALGISTPKMIEGHVVCFFQLCQAAALGTHVIGKKGQPTRLRLDRDELPAYSRSLSIAESREASAEQFDESAGKLDSKSDTPNSARAGATQLALTELTSAHAPRVTRVFVSCGRDSAEFAERIRVTLDFADIECHVVVRENQDASMITPGAAEIMRRCEAGIIIVEQDGCVKDGAGTYAPGQSLLIEIGAAAVIYGRRVLLVWDRHIPVPANLTRMLRCEYERNDLSWETGMEIMNAVKNFNDNTA